MALYLLIEVNQIGKIQDENACTSPPAEFAAQAAELLHISKQLAVFQESIPMLKQLTHQLVHGDLNGSNILVNEEGEVSSVLDFEFVTNDLRVMELAVCLADCIRPGQDEAMIWAKIDAFLSGYGSVMKLTEAEIEMSYSFGDSMCFSTFLVAIGMESIRLRLSQNMCMKLLEEQIGWL